MPLTPAEEMELLELETAESRLSPAETAELAQLESVPSGEKLAAEMTHPAQPIKTDEQYLAEQALAEMSGPQRFAAGAGQALTSTGRGIAELTGMMTPEEVQQAGVFDPALLSTPGGFTGNIAGHAAQMALPAGLAKTPARMALTEGAYSGLQPGTAEERGVAAAMGLTGGYLGGKLGQKFVKGVGQATPHQRSVNRKGIDLGARITPGQASKSETLLRREVGMQTDPATAKYFADINDHNQTLLNKYASRSFGEEAEEITPELLGAASDRIGANIAGAMEDQVITLGGKFKKSVQSIATRAEKGTILARGDARIRNAIDYINGLGNVIDGPTYQRARSELSKAIHAAYVSATPNPSVGRAMEKMATSLDEAAGRSLPAKNVVQFNEARKQWGNLLAVEKNLVRPDSVNVSGPKMASHLAKHRKSAYLRGKTENLSETEKNLFDFTRFASANRRIVGESGTAPRLASFMQQTVSGLRAPTAGLAALGFGLDPQTAVGIGAATYPLAAGYRGLRNQAYFSDLAGKAATLPGLADVRPRLAQQVQQAGSLMGAGAAVPGAGLLGAPLANWME